MSIDLKHFGFTLIELMIVLVIMGIVYLFAIQNFSHSVWDNSKKVSLKTLKSSLMALTFHDKAEIVCIKHCQECYMVADGKVVSQISPIVDESVQIFSYRPYESAVEIELQDFVINKTSYESCFYFSMNHDGVASVDMILYHDRVYDYMNFLEPVQLFSSLEEASSYHDTLLEKVQ